MKSSRDMPEMALTRTIKNDDLPIEEMGTELSTQCVKVALCNIDKYLTENQKTKALKVDRSGSRTMNVIKKWSWHRSVGDHDDSRGSDPDLGRADLADRPSTHGGRNVPGNFAAGPAGRGVRVRHLGICPITILVEESMSLTAVNLLIVVAVSLTIGISMSLQ